MTTAELLQVLLVEDNTADIDLTREALEDGKVANDLHVCRTGEEALDFLHGRGRHAGAPRPDLILLDLNLPRVSGHDVLRQIKSSPELRSIPVAVLTTSGAAEDIARSYEVGANCYVTKPVDVAQFMRVVQSVEEFWLGIVKLPPETTPRRPSYREK